MKKYIILLILLFFGTNSFALDITTTGELGVATSSDYIVVGDKSEPAETEPHRTLFTGTPTDALTGAGGWLDTIPLTEGAVTAAQNEYILGALLNNSFFESHEFEVIVDTGTVYAEVWSTANSYSAGTTYNRGNQTIYSNVRYFSLADSNTGNQPDISASDWQEISLADFNLHGFIEGSNRIFTLDTTTGTGVSGHARVALTAGTDGTPVRNWVYAEMNGTLDLQLSASTSEPTSPAIVLGTAYLASVATTTTQGPANQHRLTNGLYKESIFMGQQQALREKARGRVTYTDGVDPLLTITTNGGSLDNAVFTSTAGMTVQLWPQSFPAQTDTPTMYCLNHPTNPVTTQYTDLNELIVDANGDSLRGHNTRYALRIWGNQTAGTNSVDSLYVTLPTGSYSTDESALIDSSAYDVTAIDENYRTTLFNIARVVLAYQTTGSGTLINLVGGTAVQDKRGEFIGAVGGSGGGVSSQTEFGTADYLLYDSTDPTKQVDWDVSGISTATKRTIIMPDAEGVVPVIGTTAERDALTPSAGWIFFNSTTSKHQGYDGSSWNDFY